MALEQELTKEAPAEGGGGGEEDDLEIAVLTAKHLLEDGGFDVIDKAVASSSDPGQVIGQFLMQLGTQMFENMPEGVTLSPAIMLAHGGWLEQISDFIQEQLGVKREIMDKAEIYVASTAQQSAQASQQQGDPNAPPVAPGPSAAPPQAPPQPMPGEAPMPMEGM
jgi:hypothetical protein